MGTKPLTEKDIIRIAAEIGAKTAMERYDNEVAHQRRKMIDTRLRNTKQLVRRYREIKLNALDAISTLRDAQAEDFEFFKTLMEGRECVDVKAIAAAKTRSFIMIAHIDAMLDTLMRISYASGNKNEARQYRVLIQLYISDERRAASEIASEEGVDIRTIYRDLDLALDRLSSLLFGIQAVTE